MKTNKKNKLTKKTCRIEKGAIAPAKLARFSVSLENNLIKKFDALVKAGAYPTRSKAVEVLIQNFINDHSLSCGNSKVIGSLNIIYDHHKRELLSKLTSIQHDFENVIVSTHHIHLNHHNCFETVIVKGAQNKINVLLKKIKSVKGIKYASLNIYAENAI